MASALIITEGVPDDPSHGLQLRIHHLCAGLAAKHACHLVSLAEPAGGTVRSPDHPFCSVAALPPPMGRRSPLRHFRLNDAQRLRLSFPGWRRAALARIEALAVEKKANFVVSFTPGMSELGAALSLPIRRVIDMADCVTLTKERRLAHRGNAMPLSERMTLPLAMYRLRNGEGELVRRYDRVLSISGPDRQRLIELSGVEPGRVELLPNGVAQAALDAWRDRPEVRRRIVFWGNLDFAPNWTAIRYFFEQVFVPYLAERGIEWHIVGRNAGPEIQSVATHPSVKLAGFREDLFDYVADAGVMVNPMVEGSGLKNKVLEAFAIGLPVVSTPLGIDALELDQGTHCLVAAEPRDLANAVLRLLDDASLRAGVRAAARRKVASEYTWETVGQRFCRIVDDVLERRGDGRRSGAG